MGLKHLFGWGIKAESKAATAFSDIRGILYCPPVL